MKRFLILFLIVASPMLINAQLTPVAEFNFDNCLIQDETGTYPDGTIAGTLNCDCGVGANSNAFYFDGGADTILLDQDLKGIFDGDFSIGFYLWTDDAPDTYPIMSIQGTCADARDSAFFIRYVPNDNELIVELTKNFGEVVALRSELPENRCWNHVLFTRQNQTYTLYINGKFIESFVFLSTVVLGEDYPFMIGSSPCVGITDQAFVGRIDQLQFFNYALLEDEELQALNLFADEIITQDTTIFQGTSFQLNVGSTCANSQDWNPVTGLSSSTDLEPIASPDQTTLYTLTFDHGTCLSQDEVLVSVLSEDQIECENILLPTAFTPNNDALNDEYGISNAFIIDQIERFEIFDRWGLKIFETFDKNQKWDGRYKGDFMPPGTYVYKIDYSCLGQNFKKTGSFNILR